MGKREGKVSLPHKSIKSFPKLRQNSSIFHLHQTLKGISFSEEGSAIMNQDGTRASPSYIFNGDSNID